MFLSQRRARPRVRQVPSPALPRRWAGTRTTRCSALGGPLPIATAPFTATVPAPPWAALTPLGALPHADKAALVQELLEAKAQSGKTFKAIARECGWTNAFTAQLFHAQAQLPAGRAEALQAAVPALGKAHLEALSRAPMRTFHPSVLQEPLVYRLYEVSAGRLSGRGLNVFLTDPRPCMGSLARILWPIRGGGGVRVALRRL